MNPETRMEKIIHDSYGNTAGIAVRKDGKIIYEKYLNGYTAADSVHIASVTKSIVSALIGIAIEKGDIKSVDQKVLDFFPDYKVARGEKTIQNITLKDMLTMTAPYKCKTEPYEKVFKSDSWLMPALDLLGGKGKIGEFRYSPIVGTHILSGMLVNATGQSVLDFARENLFSPLEIKGMKNIVLEDKEAQLAFLKDKNANGWVVDPEGINTAGWGLTLTALDMAKIGQLYLDQGMWNGQRILAKSWVEESTKEHSRWDKLSYGYLWWIIDEKEHAFAALGDGGNVIYVNSKKNLVISMASLFIKDAKDRIKLIRNYMEPVFAS
ncbi:MAG: serine hydrolase [Lachnospiraceae bacterium]|nr:serine hydrolase [Lachnospiraceae bacterium]